ncbi:MAG: hypothetical protein IJC83_02525 [Oscillospiraceae bacterium]|nr:hypothetical protein [Oscillospiraceae bacterium]
MADYKKMYGALFNQITKTIEDLQQIQRMVEEMYISADEMPIPISVLQEIAEEKEQDENSDKKLPPICK